METLTVFLAVVKVLRSQALFACFWYPFLYFFPVLRKLENHPDAIEIALISFRSSWTDRTSSRASTDLPVKIIPEATLWFKKNKEILLSQSFILFKSNSLLNFQETNASLLKEQSSHSQLNTPFHARNTCYSEINTYLTI